VTGATVALEATINPADLDALEARIEQRLLDRLEHNGTSPWMNIDQAAEYLSWKKKRLYTLTSAKEIPHRKQGNLLLFNRHELDQWLNTYYEGPA
jgi:excisionase family DNA binding protein